MRLLTAVAAPALFVVCLGAAACGESPAPSTSDPGATASDGVTPPETAPAPLPAPLPVPGADGSLPPPVEAPTTPAAGEQGGVSDWRQVATAEDGAALGRLDQAWRLGRAEAEDRGFASQVEALGPLVDPNAAQEGRLQPPPGTYRCRTIKLGSQAEGGLAYVAYPFFQCSVEMTPGGDLILTKGTGSQRSRGLLYPDTDRRLVFIGAQAWGDERDYPRYGQNRERNQIGAFERIGQNRWRLVMPWPKQEAKLEILELLR